MPAVSNRYKIAYYPIPKIASSSLKVAIYELDTERKWKNFEVDGRMVSVHGVYPAVKHPQYQPVFRSYLCFTVVREPLERLLSVHRHRIQIQRDLHRADTPQKLKAAGLPLEPDLNTFLLNVQKYIAESWWIDHHACHQHVWLPRKGEGVEHIIPLERIDRLATMFKEHCGIDLKIPHANKTDASSKLDEVSSKARRHIEKVYARDFELYEKALSRVPS